jgi:hypothetical protein
MASHPEVYTVEGYVCECWHNITKEQYDFICKTYNANEQLKEYIERKMEDFEPDEQSWRDYRNSVAECVDAYYSNERLLINYYLKYGTL